MVIEKSNWVTKQLARQQLRIAQRIQFTDGSTVPFMGKDLSLVLAEDRTHQIERVANALIVRGPSDCHRKIFNDWLTTQATGFMTPLAEAYAKRLAEVAKLKTAKKPGRVTYRFTRSKWGHCSPQGDIQFNSMIMLAPEPVIRYLVAHEVCHLAEMNHSGRFWQLVEKLEPNYREHRAWLKRNQHRLEIH